MNLTHCCFYSVLPKDEHAATSPVAEVGPEEAFGMSKRSATAQIVMQILAQPQKCMKLLVSTHLILYKHGL